MPHTGELSHKVVGFLGLSYFYFLVGVFSGSFSREERFGMPILFFFFFLLVQAVVLDLGRSLVP